MGAWKLVHVAAAMVAVGAVFAVSSASVADDYGRFTRSPDTPVLTPTTGTQDQHSAFSPTMVKVGSTFYMVYTGGCFTCQTGAVLLGATSTDGINWVKESQPILLPQPATYWLSDRIAEADLVAGSDGYYYLFFTAIKGAFLGVEEFNIGVARSTDPFGRTGWDINPVPIVSGGGTAAWDTNPMAPSVRIEGGTVKLWYHGQGSNAFNYAIGLATAPWPMVSGGSWVSWTKYAGNPVLAPIDPPGTFAGDPSVIYANGNYHMYFSCRDPGTTPKFLAICEATSPDGTTWAEVPGFALRGIANTWATAIEAVYARVDGTDPDGTARVVMYFSGEIWPGYQFFFPFSIGRAVGTIAP